MNPISRGVRNAFRSSVRTVAIVLILALSIGLSLTMLIAHKAVDSKIKSIKSSIGNTISISPAGFNPGSQANNALSTDQLSKLRTTTHVTGLSETLNDRESTTGTTSFMRGGFGGGQDSNQASATTSLTSPVTINMNGPRFFAGDSSADTNTATFSPPVSFLGTTTPASINGATITITSGHGIDGSSDSNSALISQQMASKNNLKAGDTFTAYNTTLTVAGIFSSSTESARGTVVLPLTALQRLSGQSGVITAATVTVDSLDNLSSVTAKVKSTLGSTADVTSAQDQADSVITPLNSVRTVSAFSLAGAVTAGVVIIMLTMIMVVRERQREIGVVKAIGGSNARIVSEFMVESVTLAVLGAIIGLIIGVVGGQPVTRALVQSSSSTNASSRTVSRFGMDSPGGMMNSSGGSTINVARPDSAGGFGGRLRRNATVQSFGNIKTQVGPAILLEGFGAAILIALLGSSLAASMIARIRPSTVMRSA